MKAVKVAAVVLVASWLAVDGLPAQTPMPPTPPVSAEPDTAVARFSWSTVAAPPSALTVWPTDLVFGEQVVIILDHAAGTQPLPIDSLRVDVSWLEPVSSDEVARAVELPPPSGPRQLANFRVYREGPWQAAWAEQEPGTVQTVIGRMTDPNQLVSVRDPRSLGGLPGWVPVVLALLLLTAFVLLIRLLWRRRRRLEPPRHHLLSPPAWLQAARDLRGLEDAAVLDRDHLDGLAGILRRYLHGRFHLPAEEMTAAEVAAAANAAGWRREPLADFARLLATCDDARYAPALVGSQRLRRQVQQTVDLIDGVRIEPLWTAVPPGELAEARAAWSVLRTRYPAPGPEPGGQ